jgi:cell division transport system permease protein
MPFRPLYFTRRALAAMARGPYVALVGAATVFVAVLATGLLAGALGGAERLLAAWAGEVRISVYLAPGSDLERAREAAVALAPGHRVEAIPAEVALSRLAETLEDEAHVLEGLDPEALPDAVEVDAPGIGLAAARELAAALGRVPGAEEVDFGTRWLEALEALVARAKLAALVLFALFALATAVLVSNTLRLAVFARRDEIEIMKLAGATDRFVAAPFLIEGVLQGLAGAGAAVLVLLGLHGAIVPRLAATFALARDLRLEDTLPAPLVVALLGGGAAVGLLASALAVFRSLRRSGAR